MFARTDTMVPIAIRVRIVITEFVSMDLWETEAAFVMPVTKEHLATLRIASS